MIKKENILLKCKVLWLFLLLQNCLFLLHFVTQSRMDENSNGSGYNSSIWENILLIEAMWTSAADLVCLNLLPWWENKCTARSKGRKCSFFFLNFIWHFHYRRETGVVPMVVSTVLKTNLFSKLSVAMGFIPSLVQDSSVCKIYSLIWWNQAFKTVWKREIVKKVKKKQKQRTQKTDGRGSSRNALNLYVRTLVKAWRGFCIIWVPLLESVWRCLYHRGAQRSWRL